MIDRPDLCEFLELVMLDDRIL